MSRFKTHFQLSAEDYEKTRGGHLAFRREEDVRGILEQHAGSIRRVLEIGFGSGQLLANLAERYPQVEFRGAEIEPKMVEYALERYRRPNLSYALTDLVAEGLEDRFDFLYSIDVIHHVHDQAAFFRAVRRRLRPGGLWMAVEPNIYHPYICYHQESMRRAGLDEDHFRPWVSEPLWRQAGLVVRSRRYSYLFPGWIRRVPPLLARIEHALEDCPLLGGSVVYQLSASAS